MAAESKSTAQTLVSQLQYRRAECTDLERVFALESVSYPDDEGASKDTLRFRLANAIDLFLVAEMRLDDCTCCATLT